MEQGAIPPGWSSLLRREWLPTLAVLLGGVLLQSMNVLMLATVLPSIVGELGGVTMLSWPTTAYLASSIVAASCAGMLASAAGARTVYCIGVTTFGLAALICSQAPAMGWIVAGRLLQGFGGGLEAAVAYVLIRRTFPEQVWPRTIAMMSTSWSVSVLLGPLVGGLFAHFGSWRHAFLASAAAAGALAIAAFLTLPAVEAASRGPAPRVPFGRVALICLAIAATSFASVVASALLKLGLIGAAIACLALMLRLNRSAKAPLLPRDAFSWWTQTGVGSWLALMLCISFAPLQVYVPIFLQELHGLDPLAAGFAVASASLAWSTASIATAGIATPWPERLMLTGPLIMGLGLIAIAALTPHATLWLLIPSIALLGAGIGQCWPFVAHRIMQGARIGNEIVAASSVPTIQQTGFALGAAVAGLIGNACGLSGATADDGMLRAASFVPASFVVPALLAALAGLRLRRLRC
ncbi:MAG TPA: MFS transporter [Bradyrhizobium sp.]|uniref:MFS transporter n=1 Tax=Bradyrhizobium sp. TaxID=376 RepID=UPI002B523267|nr:MFS transporter [Bradyrhizobium sp.]HLZ06233.1 MFS transporter [Bradyrhizobium sp.]